jgi:hypothetical protein
LLADTHPHVVSVKNDVHTWQEVGAISPSAKDYPDIQIKSDWGLMGTALQSRYTFKSLPADLVMLCFYVNGAQSSDSSEFCLQGDKWISLIRKGTNLYLSDGLTSHYCPVWSVDYEAEKVTLIDRWPRDFFLSPGRNIAGVVAEASTLPDGRIVHTLTFEELKNVCLGFILVAHVHDIKAVFAVYPELASDGSFLCFWGLSILSSLNANAWFEGQSFLSMALVKCPETDPQAREFILQNINASLLIINEVDKDETESSNGFQAYGKVSLPLVLTVFDKLTAVHSPKFVEDSLRVFRAKWPDRLEPDAWIARSLCNAGKYDAALEACRRCENRIREQARKIIHVDESKVISRLLEVRGRHPTLDYYCEIFRMVRGTAVRSLIRKGELATANGLAKGLAEVFPRHGESFLLLSETTDNIGEKFTYQLIAHEAANTIEQRDETAVLITSQLKKFGEEVLISEMASSDRELARGILRKIRSSNASE